MARLSARPIVSLLLALGLAAAFCARPLAEPIVFDDTPASIDVAASAEYYADRSGKVSLDEARRLARAGEFRPYRVELVRFDATRPTHWLFFDIKNTSAENTRLVLDLGLRVTPLCEIFIVRKGVAERVFRHDLTSRYDQRPIRSPSIAAPIVLEPGVAARVFVRVRINTDLDLSPRLDRLDAFYARLLAENRTQFIFFGFLACYAIASVAVSIALREASAAYYAAYVASIILYLLHLDGLAFWHLWPSHPAWSDMAQRPLQLAVVFFGALFARAFFKTRETMPIFDRIYLVVATIAGLGAATTLVSDHRIFSLVAFIFLIISAQLYWITGAVAVLRSLAGAWFFLFGAASVAVAGVIAAAAHLSPAFLSISATRDIGRVAFVVEAFAFLMAIGSKIARLRRERERNAAQAIEALEQKLALTQELRRAEEAFHHAASLAETRRAAMAHATHDLRQPLTSMRLSLKELSSGSSRDYATLERHCAYLEALIDRYLDVRPDAFGANAELDEVEAAPAPEVLPARLVLETVCAMYLDEATAKGLSLRMALTSLRVEMDPLPAVRVLSNLVSNAVKYTEKGGVLIGARPSGDRVRFVVYDTGRGIDEAERARLMRPGARGETSTGSGLGLAVAQELVAAHHFDFCVRSKPGRGSCFGFSVRRASTVDGAGNGHSPGYRREGCYGSH